jgi:hypothetical protein
MDPKANVSWGLSRFLLAENTYSLTSYSSKPCPLQPENSLDKPGWCDFCQDRSLVSHRLCFGLSLQSTLASAEVGPLQATLGRARVVLLGDAASDSCPRRPKRNSESRTPLTTRRTLARGKHLGLSGSKGSMIFHSKSVSLWRHIRRFHSGRESSTR